MKSTMWFRLGLPFILCGLFSCAQTSQYKNFKVYDIIQKDDNQTEFLHKLWELDSNLDFWSLARAANTQARVMVPPKKQAEFEETLKGNGITFSIFNNDISKTIQSTLTPAGHSISGEADFTKYLRFNEINAYLDSLAARYPKTVTVQTVGKSFEGRSMKIITIGNGVQNSNKSVIFIDAGIHAREWIAPAGALYVIHQLAENSMENKHLLEQFDWKILPLVNPDGYEYTHTDQRLWKKTRSLNKNKECSGTDGNRNFDIHWAEIGSSTCECSQIYHGPVPFSEPETKIVRDIMHSISGRCKMYLSLHSYGRYILHPWGWTSKLPSTWRDLHEVASAGANAAFRSTGSKYEVGSSTNVLYAAAGRSDDYAFAKANIPIAMTMMLPSGGSSGFDPHPSQIKALVSETWVAISAMAEKVAKKYN